MERKPNKPEKPSLIFRIRERIRKIATNVVGALIIIVSLIAITVQAHKLRPLIAMFWP